MNTAVLIPAYEPDEILIDLVSELSNLRFPMIVVVDDGSSKKCSYIFRILEKIPNCTVIHHEINRGKGAALKTGMKSILDIRADIYGCITVDADGQHLMGDIIKIAKAFEKRRDALILGCRNFNNKNVPFRSRFGNLLTRTVFKLSTGKTITDTQTGLRAIPVSLMKRFQKLPGDRYEFEMNMLMEAARSNIKIEEVTIQTVYINHNKASHFKPLLDGIRIYKEILKFSFSSLISAIVDIGFFSFFFWLFSKANIQLPLLVATISARIISSTINFTLNKRVVFESRDLVLPQAAKYYLLCSIQMIFSWLLVESFVFIGLKHVVVLKMLSDTLLFFASYIVQKLFIFGRSVQNEKSI